VQTLMIVIGLLKIRPDQDANSMETTPNILLQTVYLPLKFVVLAKEEKFNKTDKITKINERVKKEFIKKVIHLCFKKTNKF